MTLGYADIKPKRIYKITGNTFANSATLRKIGAQFVDETPDHDAVGARVKADKYWILDLSSMSYSAWQRSIQPSLFGLVRGGCVFSIAEDK
jgi:hypothetical protein